MDNPTATPPVPVTTKPRVKLTAQQRIDAKYAVLQSALDDLAKKRREIRAKDTIKKERMFGRAAFSDPALVAALRQKLSSEDQAWLLAQEKDAIQ